MGSNPPDLRVHPQFFEACFTILLASSLALYTLVFGQPGRARQLFLALIGSIVVWSGGVALSRALSDPAAANLAVRASFVGIFALPPVWYALALHLTRRAESLRASGASWLLAIPSGLALVCVATNPWHHLYMRDPSMINVAGPLDWAGPLFWAWAAWAYLLVFGASVRYVGWSWRLVAGDARWRGGLVAVASILPLSGNVAHLLGWTAAGHDFTPLLLGAATVMLFVADWRFRLLDTLPIARRDVIEQLRDGVIVADARGVILDMNPAAERMVHAPLAELVGKPIVRAVAAQAVDRFDFDETAFNAAVVQMCSSATGFETQVENYEGLHFEVRGSGVRDPGGQISGLYVIMRDITVRSRLEEVQRESRRAQTIASLAAGITHEVNNPLSYVRANLSHVLDVLSEASDKDDPTIAEVRGVLAEALEGADRIGSIVERVRKFTHTRGAKRESISIASIVEEACRLSVRRPRLAIELATDVAEDLPDVFGFRDGLLEAVLNLLDNAQNALGDDGGAIQIRAYACGTAVRIEIEDDGPGVPDGAREDIFEPFFTTERSDTGTGLGLAISGKLVADLGGTLTHEAPAGGGSRFVIEVPVGDAGSKGP